MPAVTADRPEQGQSRADNFLPDVEGSVKILCDSPREMLEAGLSIPIRITTAGKNGPIIADYYLLARWCPKTGRLEGMYLTKDQQNGDGCEVYSFQPADWRNLGAYTCSCGDFLNRAHKRREVACRHTKTLWAVIRRLGLA